MDRPETDQGGRDGGERRRRLSGKNCKEVIKFDCCGIGKRKLQDLSRGHNINYPVFFAEEFRIYPKYHDFQQESITQGETEAQGRNYGLLVVRSVIRG